MSAILAVSAIVFALRVFVRASGPGVRPWRPVPAAAGAGLSARSHTHHGGLVGPGGQRALTAVVICCGILAEAAAFSLTMVSTATSLTMVSTAALAVVAMLYAVTAARSVLWTVSYPLAATSAERDGMGLGAGAA